MFAPRLGYPVTYVPFAAPDDDGNPGVAAQVAGILTRDNGDGTWALCIFPPNKAPETVDSAAEGTEAGTWQPLVP